LVVCLSFQFGRHFWVNSSFLYGLKIDFLSPTLYIQDVLIVILVFQNIKTIADYVYNKRAFVLIFVLLAFINIIFSISKEASLFFWIRILESILLIIILIPKSQILLHLLEKILPFLLIFQFILGSFQIIMQKSIGNIFWFFGERSFTILTPGIAKAMWIGKLFLRPYGTFSHPNSLAGFSLISILILLGKKKQDVLSIIGIIFGFLLVVLCFSRTVWLAGMVILFIYLFVLRKNKVKYSFWHYLLPLLLALALTFLFTKTTIENDSFIFRQKLAEVSLSIIQKYPLFGVGANNFLIKLSSENPIWGQIYFLQPVHNIILLVASELGVFLSLFFSLIILRSLYICWRINRFLFLSLLAICITGFFDHYWITLEQNRLLLIFILAITFGLSNGKMRKWKKIGKSA